jgi:hypothetical protein
MKPRSQWPGFLYPNIDRQISIKECAGQLPMLFRRSYHFQTIAPWLVFFLFLLKVSITCIWVVRPWDVPDEVGHFSYIKDLATGKGFPVLHESRIDKEIWTEFAPGFSTAGSNWIAQHPPLYHLTMVPVYWVGSLFNDSIWGSFYLIRLATAVLFGLGILIFVKAMREAGLTAAVALGLALMLASIPNHTYLAGAVNHDAMVFLSGSLVLLFWVRFSLSQSRSDLLCLGLFLGLGGVVKYTFLVLYPPIICLVLLSIWKRGNLSRKQLGYFMLLVSVPIGIWMIRNLILLGSPLPVDTTGFHSDKPFEMSFLKFGSEFPVFSIILQSFWGLLGWMGDGTLRVRWLEIYAIYQQAFTWPLIIFLALSFFYLAKDTKGSGQCLCCRFLGLFIVLYLLQLVGWLDHEYHHFLPLFLVGAGITGWSLSESFVCLKKGNLLSMRAIEIGALGTFLFFLLVHYYKIYSFSIPSGTLQGTFGRYYLPVIGFFVIGFVGPGLKRFPLAAQLVMVCAMVYSCTELYVWLHEAVPFFAING